MRFNHRRRHSSLSRLLASGLSPNPTTWRTRWAQHYVVAGVMCLVHWLSKGCDVYHFVFFVVKLVLVPLRLPATHTTDDYRASGTTKSRGIRRATGSTNCALLCNTWSEKLATLVGDRVGRSCVKLYRALYCIACVPSSLARTATVTVC